MQPKESSKLTDIQKKQKSNLGKFKTSLSPKSAKWEFQNWIFMQSFSSESSVIMQRELAL